MGSVFDDQVLVLNKHWKPIATTTVSKSINKIINNRFKIVGDDYRLYSFEEWIEVWSDAIAESKKVFNYSSTKIPIPEIVIATEYGGVHSIVNRKTISFSRKNVFLRDQNTCQYCGKKLAIEKLNLDHVIPSSKGGKTTWENIVVSCFPCNTRKRNRTPLEANMKLLKTPSKPQKLQMNSIFSGKIEYPKSWEEFLGTMYWNVELKQ